MRIKRKYIVLVGDGMADEPKNFHLNNTPLTVANTPAMDMIARRGTIGLVRTIPEGIHAGSDVANMSILGYNPLECYTGRAPIEAMGLGIELKEDETAFRCNLVSYREEKGRVIMDDYSAGHITDSEARELIETLNEKLSDERIKFYPSVSYRNICLIKNFQIDKTLTPPHDILEKPIDEYLPVGEEMKLIRDLMEMSQRIFSDHPINDRRRKEKKKLVSSIWLWGQGKLPRLKTLWERFGVKGAVVSGVDLVRGIGRLAGLEVIRVPGATGYIDTNYEGKVDAALKALEKDDFVYLHVEAPDEASHCGDLKQKILAIELFDSRVVKPILEALDQFEDFSLLLMPDHLTPVKERTHRDAPVPFAVLTAKQWRSGIEEKRGFDEESARKAGIQIEQGYKLLEKFLFGR